MTMHFDDERLLSSGYMNVAYVILVTGAAGLLFTWNDPQFRPQFRLVALITVGALLVTAAFVAYRLWRIRQALGTAFLDLDYPVPLGFRGTATYSRPLHGAELRSVEVRLKCEEEIVSGSGKSRARVTKVIHDEVLTPAVSHMIERLEIHFPVRIPETGPATFFCDVAITRWLVRLELKMRGCPDTASSFRIEVAPAVSTR